MATDKSTEPQSPSQHLSPRLDPSEEPVLIYQQQDLERQTLTYMAIVENDPVEVEPLEEVEEVGCEDDVPGSVDKSNVNSQKDRCLDVDELAAQSVDDVVADGDPSDIVPKDLTDQDVSHIHHAEEVSTEQDIKDDEISMNHLSEQPDWTPALPQLQKIGTIETISGSARTDDDNDVNYSHKRSAEEPADLLEVTPDDDHLISKLSPKTNFKKARLDVVEPEPDQDSETKARRSRVINSAAEAEASEQAANKMSSIAHELQDVANEFSESEACTSGNHYEGRAYLVAKWYHALEPALQHITNEGCYEELTPELLDACNQALKDVAETWARMKQSDDLDNLPSLFEQVLASEPCHLEIEMPWTSENICPSDTHAPEFYWSYVWTALLRRAADTPSTDHQQLLRCLSDCIDHEALIIDIGDEDNHQRRGFPSSHALTRLVDAGEWKATACAL